MVVGVGFPQQIDKVSKGFDLWVSIATSQCDRLIIEALQIFYHSLNKLLLENVNICFD